MPPPIDDHGDQYLLRRIDQKLDAMAEKLESKADRQAVHKLASDFAAQLMLRDQRIEDLAKRLHEVEQHDYAANVLAAQARTRFTRREKTIGAVVAIIAAIGTLTNIAVALYVYA